MFSTRLVVQMPHNIDANSDKGHTQHAQQNLVTKETTSLLILPPGFLQGHDPLKKQVEPKRNEQWMESKEGDGV